MGHAIGGGFLKATTKEAAMREAYANAQDFAAMNVDRGENPDGIYDNSFKFYNRTFDTEEEAEDFFDSLGSYRDGVCMVKVPSKAAEKKYQDKVSNIRQKQKKMEQVAIEAFKQRTSKSVGCKKCGVRIPSSTALNWRLHCPNCRNWLVSDSYKARFEKLNDALKLAEEQYKKDSAMGKPKYWAKYEVHC